MSKIFKTQKDIIKPSPNSKIGKGAFSDVILVHHKKNPKKKYAMKELLKKDKIEEKYIKQEILLHKNLNHKNIIKLEDFLETPKKMFIFLELAEKGDLFEFLKKNKICDQKKLKFFHEICEAIKYIHLKNIMHRDLKPENILINSENCIKLCDFGWAAEYLPNFTRNSFCGTYEYMAPEIFLSSSQNKKTDIWSLGILLFEIFEGFSPFRFKNISSFLENLKNLGNLRFSENLDFRVKKLILKILKFKQEDRPSIEEILEDDIFLELGNQDFCVFKKNEEKKFFDKKKNFMKKKNFGKKILKFEKNKNILLKAKSDESSKRIFTYKNKTTFKNSFFKKKNFMENLTKNSFKKNKTSNFTIKNKIKKNDKISEFFKIEKNEINKKIENQIFSENKKNSNFEKIDKISKLNYKIKKHKKNYETFSNKKNYLQIEKNPKKIVKRFLSPQPFIKKFDDKNKRRKTDLNFYLNLEKIHFKEKKKKNFKKKILKKKNLKKKN